MDEQNNWKTFIKNLTILIVALAVLYGIYFYSQNLRGIAPVISPPAEDITEVLKPGENNTNMPLTLPDGFKIEVFAKDLPGARVMAFDGFGNMWLSRTSAGVVSQMEIKDGKVVSQNDVLRNLRKPHGLAFSPDGFGGLYFAEEDKVSRIATYSDDRGQKIADLPTQGGGHFTRTLGFGLDGRLYVSIGSSCNVCNESDERRAAIYSMKPDGSDFKLFAKGLRNTVFFTWDDKGKMWGTDMGRDLLGDNTPPEEVNIIEQGNDYGWPICYGNNIHDTNFDKNQYIRNPCEDKTAPAVEMQAHSAPLGIAFVPAGFGPADWENDLIVAFHGSWNRSTPTGYKLVRIKLSDDGKHEGTEDFITGWLQGSNALGRPVDVKFHNGELFITDDKAGVIYKIIYGN